MWRFYALVLTMLLTRNILGGIVEKHYYFHDYQIASSGEFSELRLPGTHLSGFPGQPALPWHQVALMLPPGEYAVSMEILREDEFFIPGKYLIRPSQHVRHLMEPDTLPFLMDRQHYLNNTPIPETPRGKLLNQSLHGYAFALTSFSPCSYNPGKQKLSFFRKVTVRIHTAPVSDQPLPSRCTTEEVSQAVHLAQNPEMAAMYISGTGQSPFLSAEVYQYLVITPTAFKNEFQQLISFYNTKEIDVRVVPVDSILMVSAGFDAAEKIRNYILARRQESQIEYVLLAGNPSLVPCRYLHCTVLSAGTYYDSIPSDLYYAALDGTFDLNGNHKYGEIADSVDLLPELSVGRFPVNDTAELRKMIRKTVAYQWNPVRGEFSKPLLASEYLYSNPQTFGSVYMELLVDDHSDNGYFTHGIPSLQNTIGRLHDSLVAPPSTIWQWNSAMLLNLINQGNSFIHHTGHASTTYLMRLGINSVVNSNFAQVDGSTHNYQLLYTHGCECGAFDRNCIAARAVKIDNFLVAGIFNSRYGWFNQGTSDGPSEHLHREFVSALYNDSTPQTHIGTAHTRSKIMTAPWVSLPGEFEPGAQRWCHYGSNLLGDPALKIWTFEPDSFNDVTWTGALDSDWSKPGNWDTGLVPGSLSNVIIPGNQTLPVIDSPEGKRCNNLTIHPDAILNIAGSNSLVVLGTVTLLTE